MIIVLRQGASQEKIAQLQMWLQERHIKTQVTVGEQETIIGCLGDVTQIDEGLVLAQTDTVARIQRIQEPYKAVNRIFHPKDTVVEIPVKGGTPLKLGGGNFQVIAGPCSVESEEQVVTIAKAVKASGATMLRGGAFKPRTSPYAFQGMRGDGLKLLSVAKRETGLPIVSEIMDPRDLPLFDDVDVLQIGARNMQNYELLKEVGANTRKPILLKRGFAATIKELLMCAEYVVASGNPNVILCERGIRTFETATRNTLDLTVVPLLHSKSHLPIIVDPSHATGVAALVDPVSRAATVIGADGLIIEVHNDPPHAKCDGAQSLTPAMFDETMANIKQLRVLACKGISLV